MRVDDLVRRAAPITDDELAELRLDAFEAELCDAIVARPAGASRRVVPRRRLVPAAAAFVAAALAAVFLLLPSGGGTDRAWAAELVQVAESVPRLLVDGWDVTRADQFAVGMGEMQLTRGGESVELSWRRGRRPVEKDPTIVAWRVGEYVVELHGEAAAEARRRVRRVSVDEWLSAMPASVIKPADSEVVVDRMLKGLPLPPGFDRAALDTGGNPRDRYQLGARVTAAVACGWIASWVDGDATAKQRAVTALQTSRGWPVLAQMAPEGAYGEVLAQYVEAIATDGTVMGGKELTVAESYKDALGC